MYIGPTVCFLSLHIKFLHLLIPVCFVCCCWFLGFLSGKHKNIACDASSEKHPKTKIKVTSIIWIVAFIYRFYLCSTHILRHQTGYYIFEPHGIPKILKFAPNKTSRERENGGVQSCFIFIFETRLLGAKINYLVT